MPKMSTRARAVSCDGQNRNLELLRLLVADVVSTVSRAVCAVAPLMLNEEGMLQVTGLTAPAGAVTVHCRATVPVNPFVGVIVIVAVLPVVAPGVKLVMLPLLVSVKLGGATTVTLTVVVWLKLPEVPVMVIGVGPPRLAELLAESVSKLEVAVLNELKDAVTPLGRPEADKFTEPVNPPDGVTVMVLVLPPCWTTLIALGDAERVYPGVTAVVFPDKVSARASE